MQMPCSTAFTTEVRGLVTSLVDSARLLGTFDSTDGDPKFAAAGLGMSNEARLGAAASLKEVDRIQRRLDTALAEVARLKDAVMPSTAAKTSGDTQSAKLPRATRRKVDAGVRDHIRGLFLAEDASLDPAVEAAYTAFYNMVEDAIAPFTEGSDLSKVAVAVAAACPPLTCTPPRI